MEHILGVDERLLIKSIGQIFTEDGSPLDMSKLELLSDRGHEFWVFRYLNTVIKIYKVGYQLTHLTLEELNTLKAISTRRILLPTGTLWNANHELMGYQMSLILGERSIDNDDVQAFLDELDIIRQDLDLLSSHSILLRDINLSNTIYNGCLYLVDPGNYLVDGLEKLLMQIEIEDSTLLQEIIRIVKSGNHEEFKSLVDSLPPEEKLKYIRKWNYNKINSLIDLLLFSKQADIDPFQFRQIVQFIMSEREKNGFDYNSDVLRMFFNPNLPLGESINDFIKKHIQDNPEERKLFFSLY